MKETTFMELIDVLKLKPNKQGMYVTAWGNKTVIGLKATIERIIANKGGKK